MTSGSAAVAAGSWSNQYGLLYGSHWNGRKWSDDDMPIVGPDDGTAFLSGVASVKGGHTWAAGTYYSYNGEQSQLTLILRWSAADRSWHRVKSQNPAGNDPGAASVLNAVATDSRTDAWAVGRTSTGPSGAGQTLIEHWNGTSWTVVPSPNPGQPGCRDDELLGVTASAAATWAVGDACGQPIALQLSNGQWAAVATPKPSSGVSERLASVAATSASNAWAVGTAGRRPLILHWNGTSWGKPRVAFPAGASSAELSGVTAVSPAAAWAVGKANYAGGKSKMLIEKWNGTNWTLVTVLNPVP